MPIQPVTKKFSNRGSIKDIAQGFYMTANEPPTALELRMKHLYELSVVNHDKQLQRDLGFIVMSEPGNQAAFPITITHHREYVNSLSQELKNNIQQQADSLEECFDHPSVPALRMKRLKQCVALHTILQSDSLIKIASANGNYSAIKRSFKRV